MFIGSQQMHVKDEAKDISFPVLVLYPTEVSSAPVVLGPYTIDVTPDAPIAAGSFPLVIISHGTGGAHLLYLTIATHLAQKGYAVAMLEHYGNNRHNNVLEGTDENLINRPKHVQLTIDSIIAKEQFKPSIQADKVAIIGHSMGDTPHWLWLGAGPGQKQMNGWMLFMMHVFRHLCS